MHPFIFRISLFLLAVSFVFVVQAQTISIQLIDEKTETPVRDAFVFLQNSSIGTNSNQEGIAILETKGIEDFEVIITHINYESRTISAQALGNGLNRILLQERSQDLTEIVIASKKKNARKRRQWMRRFESAFFGPNTKKRDIEFLNPEVIWFEVSDSLFEAKAIDNLVILNKATGYQLQFVLEHFSINSDEDIRYAGKLFFEDVKDQFRRVKRIEQRRQQLYLQSKPLFFSSLSQQLPLNTKQFEFGRTVADGTTGSYSYTPLDFEALNWRRGLQADTLLFQDYLTIISKNKYIPSATSPKAVSSIIEKKLATSFLRSASHQFIIDHYGRILNPADIEESGYWTDYRIASELPIDYEGRIQLSSSKTAPAIIDSLLQYQYRKASEKIYLHLNQPIYSNREHLWFKAYLVDAISHLPSTPSEVVYVDLINPEAQVIHTWCLHRQTGLTGDFQWTRNHDPGTYRIRAYTNYMRNTSADYFFEQKIEVRDYLNNAAAVPLQKGRNKPQVTFFPEGGDLIANTQANVTFQVRDSSFQPITIEGAILNEDGTIITECKTYHQGIGLFNFIPQAEKKFYLQFMHQGEKFRFQLPRVYPQGISLHANPVDKDFIYVKIESNLPAEALEKAFIVGHIRGAVFLHLDQLRSGQTIQLAKSDMPTGLLHFTVFDSQEQAQAERLVFNDYEIEAPVVQIQESNLIFQPNQRYQLPIQVDSSLLESTVDLSLSILDDQWVPSGKSYENIQSYLLLNADLPHSIPQAGFYLSNINNQKRYYLDLLLQCLTWRRFTWRSLLAEKPAIISYPAEKGYTITGYTTKKEDTSRIQTQVMLNTLEENFIYKQIQTDEQGNFEFTQLPFMDSTTYIIQGRINRKGIQEEGVMEGNRLVDLHIHPLSRAPLSPPAAPLYTPINRDTSPVSALPLSRLREKALIDEQNSTVDWTIDLEGVDITGERVRYTSSRPGQGKIYNLDAMNWILPNTQGTTLLAQLAPRNNFYPGPEGKLLATYINSKGQVTTAPVVISIDGMGAEPGGSNAGNFLALTADEIQSIYIGKTSISITTRPIPRSRAAYLDSGILQYEHPGYHRAREFYTPDYSDSENDDLRTNIQWVPNLTLNEKGRAVIDFSTGASPKPYQILLQGVSSTGKIIHYQSVIDWQ